MHSDGNRSLTHFFALAYSLSGSKKNLRDLVAGPAVAIAHTVVKRNTHALCASFCTKNPLMNSL